MKIGIIVQGSNGDVELLVPLALALVKNGHEVEVFIITINDRDYSFLNDHLGLIVHQKHIHSEFKAIQDDLEFWKQSEEQQGEIFLRLHAKIKRHLVSYSMHFCKEKDLIIGSQHIFELVCLAEKFNTPYVSFNYPIENIRTRYEAPFSSLQAEDKDIEHLWDNHESLHNGFALKMINQFRDKHELPQINNVLRDIFTSKFLNLIPYSKYLVNPKPDWDVRYHLCGFLKSADDYSEWQLPQALLNFIDGGEKPVFITVGSMAEHENDIRNLQNILLAAARLVNRKVIVHSKWEDENSTEDNVFKLNGFISYPQILSRCDLAVHHGGIGVLHHSTEAGCPSVVIKYGHDQPYNAKILMDAGICSGSIHRKDLTAEALAKLIRNALENKLLKEKAEMLVLLMKSENAIADTVRLLEMKIEQSNRFNKLPINQAVSI